MKVLVFFCLIAACTSLSLSTTSKRIIRQNGAIIIASTNNQLSIMRSADPRKLELSYKTTTGFKLDFELSQPVNFGTTDLKELLKGQFVKMGKDYTQFDIIDGIFSQYEGMVDDLTFNLILKTIDMLVHNGMLNKHLPAILKYIETPEEIKDLLNDVVEPKIMVSDVVMPFQDGVARMRQVSSFLPLKDTEKVQDNKYDQKERLNVIPLEKNNGMGLLGVQKYLPMDTATPMQRFQTFFQPNNQYQTDVMMAKPLSMYQQYMTPMYPETYQGFEYGMNYPMVNRMYEPYRQTYMTPMNRFWERVVLPQTQKQPMMTQYYSTYPQMQERTLPENWMYQFPLRRELRQDVTDYMMEKPVMDENMMYEAMMKRRMMEDMMKPEMSEMMFGNGMDDRMMGENMVDQKVMIPYVSAKMAQELKNQRLMEQRMMMDEMMREQERMYMMRQQQKPMQLAY